MPTPGHWLAIAVLSLSGVAAFGLAPDTTLPTVATRTVERALPLPALPDDDAAAAVYWREERVLRGDTIGSLLARAGVDDADAMRFMRTSPDARPLYQLRPGRPVRVAVDGSGALVSLEFRTGANDEFVVERAADGFRATTSAADADVRTVLRSGEIRTSLFGAADAAGIPDAVTIALAEVFAGDIDFHHDLQRGDRFTVVYEERYIDGEATGTGRIVAAEFVNRGQTLRAFLWRDEDGRDAYYTEEGRSARNAFLRSPMEFSRITSGFSLARFHPILQQWRAHQGVDYAAPAGTPVRATADGIVTSSGWQGGYGNAIFLRHQGTYSTVYGHLSKIAPAVKAGARVRQGDTIGYVGATGWATGPHLHYEFRIAGEARNPLTVAMPVAEPIGPERLAAFRAGIAPHADTLALARTLSGTALAAAR
ncbi:MAG: peptidoglycan DD-metalloendopeptidase family protein [Betaproteobacteria bacterium]|nr:peptidoglycan DD-metalloendopeptidase family protein [Betaproteobacteria bacterium]